MNVLGMYQDSGKIYYGGASSGTTNAREIKPNTMESYKFVKHSGSATGSNGVMVLNLQNYDKLVIFYENPWSSWNFAAVCVFKSYQNYFSEDFMEDNFYDVIYDSIDDDSPLSSCIVKDNTDRKQYHYAERKGAKYNQYEILAEFRYRYYDGHMSNDCYTQEIDVVVKF